MVGYGAVRISGSMLQISWLPTVGVTHDMVSHTCVLLFQTIAPGRPATFTPSFHITNSSEATTATIPAPITNLIMAAAPPSVLLVAVALALMAAPPAALAAPVYNCSQLHPQCTACAMKPIGVSAQLMLKCTNCLAPAFVVYNTATTTNCACAPGYFNIDGVAKGRCVACPTGYWCKVC